MSVARSPNASEAAPNKYSKHWNGRCIMLEKILTNWFWIAYLAFVVGLGIYTNHKADEE